MTAITHIGLGALLGLGLKLTTIKGFILICIGSILPDMDTTKSIVGKFFLPISYQLEKRLGHRKIFHSFILWFCLSLIPWEPIRLISYGALTHVLLDCLNIAGVQLFSPFTEKRVVLAGRKYRIRTGGKAEVVIFIMIMIFSYGQYQLNEIGGIRNYFLDKLANYKWSYQEYLKQGNKICYLDGSLRLKDKRILNREFMILGTGKSFLQLSVMDQNSGEVYHIFEDGEFLKAKLRTTNKEWLKMSIVYLGGKYQLKPCRPCFLRASFGVLIKT